MHSSAGLGKPAVQYTDMQEERQRKLLRLVQDAIKTVLCSFGCSEVGSSNLWEEKNRQNHRGGGPETHSVTGRRPVLLLPALC